LSMLDIGCCAKFGFGGGFGAGCRCIISKIDEVERGERGANLRLLLNVL
jgi:hypothetical protein